MLTAFEQAGANCIHDDSCGKLPEYYLLVHHPIEDNMLLFNALAYTPVHKSIAFVTAKQLYCYIRIYYTRTNLELPGREHAVVDFLCRITV